MLILSGEIVIMFMFLWLPSLSKSLLSSLSSSWIHHVSVAIVTFIVTVIAIIIIIITGASHVFTFLGKFGVHKSFDVHVAWYSNKLNMCHNLGFCDTER